MRSSPILILPAVSVLLLASATHAGDPPARGALPASVPSAVQDVLDTPRGGRDPATIELDVHWHEAALRWAARDGIPEADAIERTRRRLAESERQREATQGSPIITVGGDPACDFQDTSGSNGLQTALDAAATDVNGADLTIVRVARTGFYQGRRYFINDPLQGDQDLTVEGGYDDCADTTFNGQTVIDLNGNDGPVISIFETTDQQTVRLEQLTIRGASSTDSDGGAVWIENNNFVIMEGISLLSNSAGRGGGVFIDDNSSDGIGTFLWLLGSNVIRFNSAETEGGGIWCNQSESIVLDDMVLLADNSAENGGGIHTELGCVVTSYASAPGGILDNSATVDGGGLFLDGPNDTFALIGGENSFFGFGDASSPTLLDGNTAGRTGGGLRADGNGIQVNAFDAHITNNRADDDTTDGFIGSGGGLALFFGASLTVDRTLDAVDCHSPIRCSQISGNAGGAGSAVYMFSGNSSMDIRQTFVTGNQQANNVGGSSVITYLTNAPASGTSLLLEGVVVADNTAFGDMDTIWLDDIDSATIAYSTLTGNHDSSQDQIIRADGTTTVNLYSSIAYEDLGLVFDADWGGTTTGAVDCVNVREFTSLPAGATGLEVREPSLGIEYSLTPNSPALDTCDTFLYNPQEPDIASQARGIDQPAIEDRFGPFDLGAWESNELIQPGQIAFRNGVIEVVEADAAYTVTLDRVGGTDGELRVDYFTINGTATVGDDYLGLDDSLVWAPGDGSSKQVQLTIVDDALFEGAETLSIGLRTANELTSLTTPSNVQVTIFDDETTLFADGFEGG